MQCGRVHPPPCYGRNFEHAPSRQVHATIGAEEPAYATYEFASNADLQWPALEPYKSACAVAADHTYAPIAAAAPLPFQAPRMTLEPSGMPALSNLDSSPGSVDSSGAFVKPTPANLSVPLTALNNVQLEHLKVTQPDSMLNVQMSAATAMQLLSKSSILHSGRPEADSPHSAAAGSVSEDSSRAMSATSGVSSLAPQLTKTAGLYMLDQGVALIYEGKVHDVPARKLYDTGSEVNLLSQRFADRCSIPYSPSGMCISTSLGGAGRVVGKVDGPVHTVLNPGTAVEGRTFTPPATKLLVVSDVDSMYDVLLSSHCTHDWGSRPDPVTQLLEYRPYLTRGDIYTMASVPLQTSYYKNWKSYLAAGVFMCGATSFGKVEAGIAGTQAHSSGQRASSATHSQEPGPTNNKRKGRRAFRPPPRATSPTSASYAKANNVSTIFMILMMMSLSLLPQAMSMDPATVPVPPRANILSQAAELPVLEPETTIFGRGRSSLPDLPHLHRRGKVRPFYVLTTTTNDTQPGGVPTVPQTEHMEKDAELGVIWGNHPGASPHHRSRLREVVSRKKDSAFAYDVHQLGTYVGEVGPYKIDLQHSQPLIAKRRRKSALEQEIQNEKCSDLLKAGLIKPAPPGTQYASECVLPAKKDADGNYTDRRFCIDYRDLNAITEPDRYGMHRPDEIFRDIAGNRYFTKMDLRSGFHQIPVAPLDQPKTSFWWKNQIWMWTRMPFGARNATAHFQRVLDAEIAKSGLQNHVASFVDDLLIYSPTADDHVRHLEQVLAMLEGCGLKAHPDKTVICASTIEFLGHNISADGLQPNEAKVMAIRALQPPSDVSGLRSILGFIGYYRCYIPNFSKIASPLNQLLRKGAAWKWEAPQQTAFDTLKAELCTEGRVLRHMNPHKPLILHTDWSHEGIGAVLGQLDDDGNEYLVACISRSLNAHERNYSSPQGEMLAAVWAIKSLHTYLHGVFFYLITDHQPLTYLITKPDLVGILARWAISIQQYNFVVVHRPGAQHQNADCLSRMPQPSTFDTTGARMHDESHPPARSNLAVQLAACSAVLITDGLHSLYSLPHLAPFSDTFAPVADDMISNETDPVLPQPSYLAASCATVACKGGVTPAASFLAANSTQLPAGLQQQHIAECAEAEDSFRGGKMASSDVWLDNSTIRHIQGSLPADTPAHESMRAARRAKVYTWHAGKLYRDMPDGMRKQVPAPAERESLIKTMHENHGHFGVKRTTALLHPFYWWSGMGRDVKTMVNKCALCDRVNTAFNTSAQQLQPLPIQGLFYRWGVDLAGPFNPVSRSGNRYVVVMVEHFSKFLDITAVPDKYASTVAQVFLEKVLCRFGSCAEVVTDGGAEFSAEFDELLRASFIDHRRTAPNHPQADGLAERAVQTIKRSLRKFCEATETTDLWDKSIPWVMLGYNCSTQASTKMSPYYMLHARHPVIPPAHVERFDQPIDFNDVELAIRNVLERAHAARQAGIIAGENLRIAQHRDTLRYATIKGGGYLPTLRQFQVGDFVYLRRRMLDSTLQIPAKKEIYRVKAVHPNGAIQLQGRCGVTLMNNVCNVAPCHLPGIDPTIDHTLARPDQYLACEVCAFMDEEDKMLLCDGCGTGWHTMCIQPPLQSIPKEEWLCPRCVKDGVTLADLRIKRAQQNPVPGPMLRGRPVPIFQDADSRRREQEHRAFEGRKVVIKEKHGRQETSKLGTVKYKGPGSGLKCFRVTYGRGQRVDMSATEVRRRLMPTGV